MQILSKILKSDFHTRINGESVSNPSSFIPLSPLFIKVSSDVLPALVSTSRGKFVVSRHVVDDEIKTALFDYDVDKIDDVIPSMLEMALNLSIESKFGNVFKISELNKAFGYIEKQGLPAQPHVCLIPKSWDQGYTSKKFKLTGDSVKFKKFCSLIPLDISFIVFLSHPAKVGLFVHYFRGPSSILLHGIKQGMAFCIL